MASNFIVNVVADGGARPVNGKVLCYGSYAVLRQGQVLCSERKEYSALQTSNQAEFAAVGTALKGVLAKVREAGKADPKAVKVVVQTDSDLVVGYMARGWKRKNSGLIRLANALSEIIAQFESVEFRKVGGKWVKSVLGH